jgi:hypothetical protein
MDANSLKTATLYAIHKHIAVKCKDYNSAWLKCKEKNADPAKCISVGKDVMKCVTDLCAFNSSACELLKRLPKTPLCSLDALLQQNPLLCRPHRWHMSAMQCSMVLQ